MDDDSRSALPERWTKFAVSRELLSDPLALGKFIAELLGKTDAVVVTKMDDE